MNQHLDAKVLYSFKEHLSYRLVKDYGASSTKTVNLYEYVPDRLPGKVAYGSAYPNWIYDSSVATVPTTVGGMVRGGAQGLRFDFENGRILVNSGNTGLSLSLSVPIREFGVKITSSPDAKLVNEVNVLQSPDQIPVSTYAKPDAVTVPVIFVKLANTKNKPFCLSGLDWTVWHIRTVVFAQNYKQLMGVGGMIRDLRERMIPVLAPAQTPIGAIGDIKGSSWNYEDYLSAEDKFIVMESSFDNIEVDTFAKLSPTCLVGVGETFVYYARYPRAEIPVSVYEELFVLLESGDFLLLESGDFLLLE